MEYITEFTTVGVLGLPEDGRSYMHVINGVVRNPIVTVPVDNISSVRISIKWVIWR